jgi:hypothetical protein
VTWHPPFDITARHQNRTHQRAAATVHRRGTDPGAGVRSGQDSRARHKKKKTTARRPELQNARLGMKHDSASRDVPRFGGQRCGKVPNYRERPTLRLGVATVRGLHKCGTMRRPFMGNRRRTAHGAWRFEGALTSKESRGKTTRGKEGDDAHNGDAV